MPFSGRRGRVGQGFLLTSGAWSPPCFFACLAAFFSFAVCCGAFFVSLLECWSRLDMSVSPEWWLRCALANSVAETRRQAPLRHYALLQIIRPRRFGPRANSLGEALAARCQIDEAAWCRVIKNSHTCCSRRKWACAAGRFAGRLRLVADPRRDRAFVAGMIDYSGGSVCMVADQ